MRIRGISVTNLFGMFNHTLPLNDQARITIILGPNGFGKTTLLKMLDGLFNIKRSIFRTVPFHKFCVEFDDESRLELSGDFQQPWLPGFEHDQPTDRSLSLKYFSASGDSPDPYPFLQPSRLIRESEREFPLSIIEKALPFLARVGARLWRDTRTGELLELEDILERYMDRLPLPLEDVLDIPDWLIEIRKSLHVHFIDTERLLHQSSSSLRSRRIRESEFSSESERPNAVRAVSEYSDHLVGMIRLKLAESAELSQSLDRTFPSRLLAQEAQPVLSYDELRAKLDDLERKRTRLTEAGLLDKQTDNIQVPSEINEEEEPIIRTVLSVYVNDVEKKLSIYDELLAKLDLLKEIINDKLLYKTLNIDRQSGFVFITDDGTPLSPTKLSSGEQHQLVMMYELLFKIPSNSLILIDEPELSLHIAWQQQFLRDISRIIALKDFDAIVATHSPSIIHDRWDLTIELAGKEQ